MLQELKERKASHVEVYPPFFIASIGCHILNLMNQKNKIYFVAGRLANLRVHIMIVAPPGFSKTFWLEQFLRGAQALLADSGIEVDFEAALTEAGFVGTTKFADGDSVRIKGVAEEHSTAIVGCEEFSAVTTMMQQQYAKMLDSALLGALDSGYVYKRLAAGPIHYQTHLTLQVGVQPARFDLSSGLGRRFCFLQFIPTAGDRRLITLARRASRGVRYNPVRTQRIRKELSILRERINHIERIVFDPQIDTFFDTQRVIHYEEEMFERLIMGYKIMKGQFDHELYVSLDEVSQRLVETELYYRDSIRRGSEFAEVLMILRDNESEMKLIELQDEMLSFGHNWSQSRHIISQMLKMKALQMAGENVKLSTRLRKG